MCGIVGAYAFQKLDSSFENKIREAADLLNKRGPDYQAQFVDQKVALGHARLSIIDTSSDGHQPMKDVTGRYHIIYNGEVYNFKSIRDELETKGYQFHSRTDTEVVLNAWVEWGVDCLSRFNGFFAVAIYDAKNKILFVARDRYGIKPVVYTQDEDYLFFASELKALQVLCPKTEIDKQALNLYFRLTYIPSPWTIYQGVNKLEPGQYLLVQDGKIEKKAYYELPDSGVGSSDRFNLAKSKIKELVIASVEKRLISDVPLGTFLSGGIDSSIVSTIAAQKVDRINTFSIGFKDNPFFDETRYAELLSKRYNTDHHTFSLTNEDLYEHLHEVVDYLDEPFADSSAIPVFILSKLTRQHVTVALSGDGADEVFGGYNKHRAWIQANKKNLSNSLIREFGGMASLLPRSRSSSLGNKARQFLKYRNILELDPVQRYWWLAQFIQDTSSKRLLSSEYQDELDFRYDLEIDESLNAVLNQDIRLVLQGDMLRKVDAMSMANSLEVRVPFLDHELVNYITSLPEDFKIKGHQGKYILREAFREDLPEELYRRGKKGFDVPMLQWFKTELAQELETTVFNEELIRSVPYFEWSEIKNIKTRLHSNNPGDVHIQVWQLFVFLKWLSSHVEALET